MGTLNSTEDVEGDQQRLNKALHLTAYSLRFGRKLPSLRFRRRVSLGVRVNEFFSPPPDRVSGVGKTGGWGTIKSARSIVMNPQCTVSIQSGGSETVNLWKPDSP
jgi:hypothetical protein